MGKVPDPLQHCGGMSYMGLPNGERCYYVPVSPTLSYCDWLTRGGGNRCSFHAGSSPTIWDIRPMYRASL